MALVRVPLLALLLLACRAEVTPRSHLSQAGTQICTGFVQAFLQKGDLTSDEVECLVSNLGNIAFGAYESAGNLVSLFGQITGVGGAGEAEKQPAPLALVAELAKGTEGLFHMMDIPIETCVKGHALELLGRAAEHFGNLTEVAGGLAANGQDIVEELSDAASAFKADDFARFGRDLGTAGRKALLSNPSSELLPEGPPSVEQLVNVSAGILQGFFGPGFELDLGSDAKIVTGSRMHTVDLIEDGVSTGGEHSEVLVSHEKKRIDIHIDLHRCVSQNLGLYRAVMSKAWLYFAEATMQPKKHVMRRFLAVMLQGLPGALARCGVTSEQQLMLMESVHAIRHVELRLRLPESPESALGAAKDLRSAAGHWSEWDWLEFGTDLGRMLQGLAVKAYPHRYVVTDVGSLERDERKAVALAEEAQRQVRRPERPSSAELASGGFTSADQLGAGSGLSRFGVQIVEGIAEGLLHREELPREEAKCLVESVGTALGGAEDLAENLISMASAMQEGGGSTEVLGEMSRSMDAVARLAEGFMSKCHSQAAEAFALALKHLGSLSYVTGRLAANGADVNDSIDEAVASMKRGDDRAFGQAVGRILRKALLSDKSKPVLPEGDASLSQIVNVTAGMIEGFFGKGFELDISSDQKIVTMPISPMVALLAGEDPEAAEEKPEAKRLDIHIDLHSCVKANMPFFQSVLTDVVKFLATEEVEASEDMTSSPFLLGALMRLPNALRKCGVSAEQEGMLMDSVQELQHLRVKLNMTGAGKPASVDRVADLLKVCVSDFSRLQWFAVGKDLGQMLRETVVTMLPAMRYSVLGGVLVKNLLGLDQQTPAKATREVPQMLGAIAPLPLAGAVLLAASMVLMRGSVAAWRRSGAWHSAVALETGCDAEDFEAGLVQQGALE